MQFNLFLRTLRAAVCDAAYKTIAGFASSKDLSYINLRIKKMEGC
jgi:hypothetical protein